MPGRRKQAGSDYYRARHSFGVMYDGEQITVNADEIVPAGSPLLKQLGKEAVEEHFEPVTSFGRWDVPTASSAAAEPEPEPEPEEDPAVEQATSAPGEKRP